MKTELIYIYGAPGTKKTGLAGLIRLGLLAQNPSCLVATLDDVAPNAAELQTIERFVRTKATDFVIVSFNDPGALHQLPAPNQIIRVEKGGRK